MFKLASLYEQRQTKVEQSIGLLDQVIGLNGEKVIEAALLKANILAKK
jgi:hypothetical protein